MVPKVKRYYSEFLTWNSASSFGHYILIRPQISRARATKKVRSLEIKSYD